MSSIFSSSRLEADSHSDWFDSLTPDQQKQYLELHPHSKFAQQGAPAAEEKPAGEVPKKAKPAVHPQGKSFMSRIPREHLKRLPEATQKFFAAGQDKPGSKVRAAAATVVRSKSKGILAALKENSKEWGSGLKAMAKLARRQPLSDHDKHALKATVKDALIITAYVGLGGGLTHGIGMALGHLGVDMLKDLALKSVAHGLVHGHTLKAANAEDKLLESLIEQIAQLVESGDIPEETWQAAIKAEAEKNGSPE